MLRSRTIPMIESKRFQNGSLTLVKNKTKPDTWFLSIAGSGLVRCGIIRSAGTRKKRS